MIKNKKKIHFLIFIISGIGLIINITFFFFFKFSKIINEENILFYFSYLTHLANISVFIWYGFSTISLQLKKEIFFWNSIWIKGLISTSIILVGFIMIPLITIIFPIFFILRSIGLFLFSPMSWIEIVYFIISNLFVHIGVPIIVFYELLKFGIEKRENKVENNKISFFIYSTIFFIFYLLWVALLTGTNLIDHGPYPMMNFFNYSNKISLFISLFIDFFILLIYHIMSYFILKKIKFII